MTPESINVLCIEDLQLHKFVILPKSVKLNVQSPAKN